MNKYVVLLENINKQDIDLVGGKNASLGEMISNLKSQGIQVPNGFATTTHAFDEFLQANQLYSWINSQLDQLDVSDVQALASTGLAIREKILQASLPTHVIESVVSAYQALHTSPGKPASVAVRSSATAEDLPDASSAGQQESYLNISGADNVLEAIKQVYASLYNDRAIAYRVHQGIDHQQVSISVTVQHMVNCSKGASGVMFSIDTESGFDGVVRITASYGLGEAIVQGEVNPDEFTVYKPALKHLRPAILSRKLGSKAHKMIFTQQAGFSNSVESVPVKPQQQNRFCIDDIQVEHLAHMAITIENHYGCPMDIEWALDGETNTLYIVQARPETVVSRQSQQQIEHYQIKSASAPLIQGIAIGQRIGRGTIKRLTDISEMDRVQEGDILLTRMTNPDWEPIMKRAAAIITDQGGRTCHAAIIARELGVPAIVGCGHATEILQNEQEVTVSCAEGETGNVYKGLLDYERKTLQVDNLGELPVSIMMNLANPGRAFSLAGLPSAGVGLARLEFIINNQIGIHPRAVLDYKKLPATLKKKIDQCTNGYKSAKDFYASKLVEGIATITAAFSPRKVIIRMSDFKSNEYAHLIGGDLYEENEENPMIGFRGASRYLSADFRECFKIECEAIKTVRNNMGLTDLDIMIPFCRTPQEAEAVIKLLEEFGLRRGDNGLRIIMMCEIPANALQANEFLNYFDGFSIGSNDLTQLTLGLDRDSAQVAHLFDERNSAVKQLISMAINACQKQGKYVGICGQAPSDYPELAEWLMREGISSLSLNPDTLIPTWQHLAQSDLAKSYSYSRQVRLLDSIR